MPYYIIILLTTLLPIIISGAISVASIILQSLLAKKSKNKDVKVELLSKICNEMWENYDYLLSDNTQLPSKEASASETSDFFVDNIICVYMATKDDYKRLKTIFDKAKIILDEKTVLIYDNEFKTIDKLDFDLFSSALADKLGGMDKLINMGIKINDDIDFIAQKDYQSSIRKYIDFVFELKAKIAKLFENQMRSLLK